MNFMHLTSSYAINTTGTGSFRKEHNLFLFGIYLEWDRVAGTPQEMLPTTAGINMVGKAGKQTFD